jgi:hypothetical protein
LFENSAEQGKSDLTDVVGFWKIWWKSEKFDRNAPETMEEQWKPGHRNVASFTDKSISLTDQLVGFSKNRCGEFQAVFAENRPIFTGNQMIFAEIR